MRTRRISITIVLLAMLVLLGVMSLAGLSGWTAAARVDQAAVSLQAYTFTGHVYRGQPYDTSTPVAGVTIGLWGDEDQWPEAGFARELLVSTVTNASGAFSLSWTPGDTFYDYLHVIEEDPETEAVLMIGEIGGPQEAEAAVWIKENMSKPVVGFVAGLTAPKGRRMGHAGAIISAVGDSAPEKAEIMRACGLTVAPTPSELGSTVAAVLGA